METFLRLARSVPYRRPQIDHRNIVTFAHQLDSICIRLCHFVGTIWRSRWIVLSAATTPSHSVDRWSGDKNDPCSRGVPWGSGMFDHAYHFAQKRSEPWKGYLLAEDKHAASAQGRKADDDSHVEGLEGCTRHWHLEGGSDLARSDDSTRQVPQRCGMSSPTEPDRQNLDLWKLSLRICLRQALFIRVRLISGGEAQ